METCHRLAAGEAPAEPRARPARRGREPQPAVLAARVCHVTYSDTFSALTAKTLRSRTCRGGELGSGPDGNAMRAAAAHLVLPRLGPQSAHGRRSYDAEECLGPVPRPLQSTFPGKGREPPLHTNYLFPWLFLSLPRTSLPGRTILQMSRWHGHAADYPRARVHALYFNVSFIHTQPCFRTDLKQLRNTTKMP